MVHKGDPMSALPRLVLSTGLLALLPMGVAVAAAPDCTALLGASLPGMEMKITQARLVPAGPLQAAPGEPPPPPANLPAHCRVEGVIDARTGFEGKPYGIGFALALPVEWNGRFLFQGGGGLNGSIRPPVGGVAAGDTPALARGFAVVSTDSGHQGAGFDGSFMADQEALLNFLYQSTDKVTQASKQLIAVHYGRRPDRSYFAGCSTGGREAMIQTQRFPKAFDGVIAGAPAMRTNYSNLGVRWVATQLNTVAPAGPDGKRSPRQAMTPGQRKRLIDTLLQSCDALDGQRDGLVFDTKGCKFDPAAAVCKAGETGDCLSSAQADAVRRAFAGPRTASGRQVYPGYLYDTGTIVDGPGLPGLLVQPFAPEGDNPTGTTMDVDAAAARAHDARSMAGDTDAWTNLSSFRGHGGKLLFFHGNSDPWFSALETVRYYEQLAVDNPGQPLQDWSRLYLAPGVAHCAGGPGLDRFDLLTPLVEWVEQGKAPVGVPATGTFLPGQSRPMCPYPAVPKYDGRGDPKSAVSYRCEAGA